MARSKSRTQGTADAKPDIPEPEITADTKPAPEIAEAPELSDTAPVVAEEPVAQDSPDTAPSPPEKPAPDVAPNPSVGKRRGGFWPMVLGGVCAAALGAGAVIYALPRLPADLAARLVPAGADLAAALRVQSEQIAGLEARFPNLTATQQEVSSLAAQITALADRVAALEQRPVPAATDVTGADPAELAELRDALAQLQARMAGVEQQREDAAAQLQAARAQAAEVQAQAEAAARKIQARAQLELLRAAFDGGQALAPVLADLQTAGIDIPPALQADLPAPDSLREQFAEAARSALRAARLAETGETLTDRVGAFLLAQTGARSLAAQEGDGPDAILSRAQGAVDAGDFAAALSEIAALPEAGKTALSDWASMAERRVAAQQALTALSETLQ